MSELTVTPSDDLAFLARSQPSGTVFRLSPGVYRQGPINPKDDQRFFGTDVVFDGEGTREYAFGGIRGGTGGKRVRLEGFRVTNYKPAAQSAAIRPFGYAYGWTLHDLSVSENANWGVQVDSGWHLSACTIHHNGTLGVGGGGNALIEYCDIYGNNTSGADSHWEGGGTKFVYSDGLIVRDCGVYLNDGPGIWFDGHSQDAQILRNRVFDNRGPGIDWEINGACLIEDNYLGNNGLDPNWADDYDLGGGGILVIDSAGVTIRNNLLVGNRGGIGLVDDARSGRDQWPNLENILIEGNTIAYTERKHGVAIASGRPGLSSSVVFRNNIYDVDPTRIGFRIGSWEMGFVAWQDRWEGEQLEGEEPPPPPPPPVKPAKPTGLEALRGLAWMPVDGADSYRVEHRTKDGLWVLVDEPEHPVLTMVERGRYRVRAVNEAGGSPWAYLLV